MSKANLSVVFAFALTLPFLGGCASTPKGKRGDCIEGRDTKLLFGLVSNSSSRFNKDCAKSKYAAQMLGADDPGMKAVGQILMEGQSDDVRKASEIARKVITNGPDGPVECEIKGHSKAGGRDVIEFGACKSAAPQPQQP